ncbi:MAG: hypothetical protein R3C11_17650 [Planctomycetaceae bacterium]
MQRFEISSTGEVIKIDNQYLVIGNMKISSMGQVQVVETTQDHHIQVLLLKETTDK